METNMGVISRIGRWIDSRWPEKISAEEVYKSLTAYSQLSAQMSSFEMRLDQIAQKLQSFENGARAFDKDLREIKDEMNKVKAVQSVMNRTRTSTILPTSEAWKR